MIKIESKDNGLFKSAKKLKERKYRTRENKYIIEGLRLVEEAFKAKMEIEHIFISEKSEDRYIMLLTEYANYFDNANLITDSLFEQISSTENSQGIIAIVKNKEYKANNQGTFYLICDKVQDPGNLGTIIRTAHAAGVDGIVLTKGTVDIYNDKTLRSTMGSIFYMPIINDDEDFTFIKSLKEEGFSIVATSLEESKNFFSEDLSGKVALTVGNEGNGVSEEIFNLSDKKVKIPMPGGAESLNVSIATSIILFEKVRQNLL